MMAADRAGLTRAQPALTRARVCLDEDRCYYGKLDANGQLKEVEVLDRVEPPPPSPSLSIADVVNAQFQQLSYGDKEGVRAAHAFLAPRIVETVGIDAERFEAVLGEPAFDGIIGCAEWEILDTNQVSDDAATVRMRILPRPVPGCVKLSGLADQDGITWPAFYNWQMRREVEGPLTGCWMLDQFQQARPPINVQSNEGTKSVAAGK